MERSKESLRFRIPKKWEYNGNNHFLGLVGLGFELHSSLGNGNNFKMLEIGTYKGEGAFIFSCLGLFDEIHTIDPWEGDEPALTTFNETWSDVKREYWTNTRQFKDIIHHHQDYSYNMVDKFKDGYFDFIYIDAAHSYDSVKKDIIDWLPKTKKLIGGHDYQEEWPGVVKAVNESFEHVLPFMDSSWLAEVKG